MVDDAALARFERMYREGRAGWDIDDSAAALRVRALVGRGAIPPGSRILDIGCGTGRIATYLAKQGFAVVGVDYSGEALDRAAARAREALVDVQFVRGNILRLDECGVSGPFDVLLDAGCFHCLAEHERPAFAAALASVTSGGAMFYLYTLTRSRVVDGPIGATRDDIDHHFGRDWDVVASEDFVSRLGEARRGWWYSMRRRALTPD